jgi:hypothetical protein
MRRSVSWGLLLGGAGAIAAVLVACPGPKPPDLLSSAVDGAWDIATPRTVTYSVSLAKGAESSTHKTTVSFLGGGEVNVAEDGQGSTRTRMSTDGRFASPLQAYLGLFAAIPAKAALDKPGATTIARFPSDAERAKHGDTVVYGATITSRVQGTGPVADVSFDGTVSLVDNPASRAALSALFGDELIPEVAEMVNVARSETPYLTGTARFDRAAGQLVSLDAYVVEFPLHAIAPGGVSSSPKAVHVTLQKEGI